MHYRKQAGFTLIELMIVVVIIAVLAGIAYPSYRNYTQKARRTDGKDALLLVAARQEQFYSRCLRYASTLTGNFGDDCNDPIGNPGLGMRTTSKEDHYTMDLLSVSATYFLARATATSTLQSSDTKCLELYVDSYGRKGSKAKGSAKFDDKKVCW